MHKDDRCQPRCVRAVNVLLFVGGDGGHVIPLGLHLLRSSLASVSAPLAMAGSLVVALMSDGLHTAQQHIRLAPPCSPL